MNLMKVCVMNGKCSSCNCENIRNMIYDCQCAPTRGPGAPAADRAARTPGWVGMGLLETLTACDSMLQTQ